MSLLKTSVGIMYGCHNTDYVKDWFNCMVFTEYNHDFGNGFGKRV